MARGGARPGAGRPRGVPNKSTIDIKRAVMNAFAKVGGEDYLVYLAYTEPKVFGALIAKCIPSEMRAELVHDLASLEERLHAGRARAAALALKDGSTAVIDLAEQEGHDGVREFVAKVESAAQADLDE